MPGRSAYGVLLIEQPADSAEPKARAWGEWTQIKLDALSSYLELFVRASTKSRQRVYFDLFAGGVHNEDRETGRAFLGSAERALSLSPGFTNLYFFELDANAAGSLRDVVGTKYGLQNASVIEGDCNVQVPLHLQRMPYQLRFVPSFAFIDQYAAEVHWSTIRALSSYKLPTKRGGIYKTELWLYFGDSLYPRGLAAQSPQAASQFAQRLDAMFGTRDWRIIYDRRLKDQITPDQTRFEYINLMRWRLENDLGYATTIPLKVYNHHARVIYTMIFVTDHPAGQKIMDWVYDNAEEAFKAMLDNQRARRSLQKNEAAGQFDLFTAFGEEPPTPVTPAGRKGRSPRPEIAPPVKPDWL